MHTAINKGYTSTRGERGGREKGGEEGERREERRGVMTYRRKVFIKPALNVRHGLAT